MHSESSVGARFLSVMKSEPVRLFVAFVAALAALAPASRTPAGTTGTLVGYALSESSAPVAGARMTAASPSQTQSGVTDGRGQLAFLALIPDTYAVTVTKAGFRAATRTAVDVIADNVRTVYVYLQREIKTIGSVTVSAGAPALVSPGTTVNVYSVNRPLQQTLVGLNGGGDLDNAYSAIAGVPGAFVAPGQQGWNEPVFLRGGAFNEIGYEFDGVPTNRSFDNLSTTNLATLGQQSLQVYTGGAPAGAQAHGLSGYVNQVVRTGAYPGFADLTLAVGTPTYYNKANLEFGGATTNRRFSYFIGIGGYNQSFRYIDNTNGAAFSTNFGMPFDEANVVLGPLTGGPPGCGLPNGSSFAGCYANHAYFFSLPVGPGGYILGPYQNGWQPGGGRNATIADRENVGNFHFRLPHANGLSDDVQLLYDTSELFTQTYSSYNDWGGPAFWNGYALTPGFHSIPCAVTAPPCSNPLYISGFQYTGALLSPIAGAPGGPITGVIPYSFPSAGAYGLGAPIPINQRDGQSNGQSIEKVQYQHFFSAASYLSVYGYAAYSNNFINSPNGQNQLFISQSPDRELWTHDRGFAADFTQQFSTHHLFSANAMYTTETTVWFDNGQSTTGAPGPPFFPAPQTAFAALVSSAAPTNGTCYYIPFPLVPGPPGAPVATSCENITPLPSPAQSGTLNQKYLTYAGPFIPTPPGFEWLALENGQTGTFNAIQPAGAFSAATPKYYSLALQDQWQPSDRLQLNIGVRWDQFQFGIPSTAGGPARAFWFTAWNNVMCFSPFVRGGKPIDETLLGAPPGTPCAAVATPQIPAGTLAPATLTNSTAGGATVTYDEVQPRVGGTYSIGGDDVIRFSYGMYTQPPQSQFQYSDTLQQNLAAYIGANYFQYGYSTPLHNVRPAVSTNYDASWEHQFAGSDTSFKLTPFYRTTQNQIQQFFLDPTTGTIGGVNAGKQTSTGFEFFLQKGDLHRNGLTALLSYTYTHSYIKYGPLPNGTTLLSGVNSSIQLYNSYTSSCAAALPNPTGPCGVFGPANAAACFVGGAPGSCATAGAVGNPYFNNAPQPLLDPTGSYPTYFVVPAGTQLQSASYGVPDYATMVLSYKHDKLTVAPLLQFIAGSRYGAPEQQIGVDPASCIGVLATPIATDPRYPNGGAGNAYDATTCTNTIVIPDQYTGRFDTPGAFLEPSYLALHAQVTYDLSSRATARVTLTNILTSCFGGSSLPWTRASGGHTCGFDTIPGHLPPAGNIYNPGNSIQPLVLYPYGNLFSASPFNAYFSVEIKI